MDFRFRYFNVSNGRLESTRFQRGDRKRPVYERVRNQ